MQIVTFDVGTSPWDDLQPPELQNDVLFPNCPGWTDMATGTHFAIWHGNMHLEYVLESDTNRCLVLKPNQDPLPSE